MLLLLLPTPCSSWELRSPAAPCGSGPAPPVLAAQLAPPPRPPPALLVLRPPRHSSLLQLALCLLFLLSLALRSLPCSLRSCSGGCSCSAAATFEACLLQLSGRRLRKVLGLFPPEVYFFAPHSFKTMAGATMLRRAAFIAMLVCLVAAALPAASAQAHAPAPAPTSAGYMDNQNIGVVALFVALVAVYLVQPFEMISSGIFQ